METLKLKTYIAALVVCAVIFLAIPAAYADLLVMSNPTQQVLRYDETTGAFIDVFASPAVIPSICGPPTTVRPFNGIAYGPDGNLYVVGASSVGGGSGAVLRYDGRTGAFIDVFALPALVNFPSQGSAIIHPSGGLTFGPDGNMYVVGGRVVLRYDGRTGAFIDSICCGFDLLNGLTFGPDGNLYVAFIGGPPLSGVLRFDPTGAGGVLPVGGFVFPKDVAFGPDGNLYVTAQLSNDVVRFRAPSEGNNAAEIFVPAGSSGLLYPSGLAFGPDGNLYVSGISCVSCDVLGQVLRFDGRTGAFIDTFVPPGSGGLRIDSSQGGPLTGFLVFTPRNIVLPPPQPHIDSLSSPAGAVGSVVTVAGINFGASRGTSTVKFGSTPAAVSSWSDTLIQAVVPSVAPDSYNVTITTRAGTSAAVSFTVAVNADVVTLSSGLTGLPVLLAIDKSNVYWIESFNAPPVIKKVPLGGGTTSVVAGASQSCCLVTGFAVDSTSVYWAYTGAISKAPIGGGAETLLVFPNSQFNFYFAVDGSFVYWTDPTSFALTKVPVTGGATIAITGSACCGLVALDDTYVYFTTPRRTIARVSKEGGAVTDLVVFTGAVDQLMVDASNVYWVDTEGGIVQKAPKDGGPATVLASCLNQPRRIAFDANNVYWAEFAHAVAGAGAIRKVSIAGGEITALASGLNGPLDVAVDSTAVYWSELGANAFFGGSGAIKKLNLSLAPQPILSATPTSLDFTSIFGR